MNASTLIQVSPDELEQLITRAVEKAQADKPSGGWFRVPAAAKYLDCSDNALRLLEKRGLIPSSRIGRSVVFSREDLDKFIRSGGAA
jgi:excisionase family DNA binding protein